MTQADFKMATRLIMALFMLQPMCFGAWLAKIPYVKEALALSKSDLALALLGMPLALMLTLQAASRIVERVGIRRSFMIVLPIQACAMLLPFAAWNVVTLFTALGVAGVCMAFLEVAMNTYAGRLEKASGRLIMSRCHGFWALGVGTGSFVAARLALVPPIGAVAVVAITAAVIGIVCASRLVALANADPATRPPRQSLRQMPKRLFLIAALVCAITMVEGAMSDWAAVYLAERWGGPVTQAGIAVSVFAGFLAGGRFAGDWMIGRLGARRTARATIALAAIGIILMTGPAPIWTFFVGLALIGLGVSVAFPLGISAAAALDDHHEAQNIATTSMLGMSAFLVGPPLIGFVAEAVSLRVAMMALLPGLGLAFLLASALAPSARGATPLASGNPMR